MYSFARDVADFARSRSLLPPESRILVAFSGGPDSCALLLALLEAAEHGLLPRPLAAAHFHHGLRRKDADEDAAFAGALCARLSLPCVIGLGAVPEERAAGGRRSPNDAARQARYAFLLEVAREIDADTIVAGHTADDQTETVLLRILRGTGPDGLSGIPVVRALDERHRVVRPLLEQTREAVEIYCRDRGIHPRRDPSNEKMNYPRSRVRALLPLLEREFNPRLRDAIQRLAGAAADDADLMWQITEALWTRITREAPRRVRLDLSLRGEHPALRSRILLRALRHAAGEGARSENTVSGESLRTLETLLFAEKGAAKGALAVDLPGGVRARRDSFGLTLESPAAWGPPAAYSYRLLIPGRVWIQQAGLFLGGAWSRTAELPSALRARTVFFACGTIGNEQGTAPPLQARSARSGDRISPFGMQGRERLVRDVMADAGWEVADRESAPVVVREDTGEILWIVGLVQAESTRIESDTERILCLSVEPDC